MTVTATEARQQFFTLLKLVEQGEEVIILRENKDHSIPRFTITKRVFLLIPTGPTFSVAETGQTTQNRDGWQRDNQFIVRRVAESVSR